MFRRVRVRAFDLDEAFGADCLIAAPSLIEVGGVIQKADRTFRSIFIKVSLKRLATDKRIVGQLHFAGHGLGLRGLI